MAAMAPALIAAFDRVDNFYSTLIARDMNSADKSKIGLLATATSAALNDDPMARPADLDRIVDNFIQKVTEILHKADRRPPERAPGGSCSYDYEWFSDARSATGGNAYTQGYSYSALESETPAPPRVFLQGSQAALEGLTHAPTGRLMAAGFNQTPNMQLWPDQRRFPHGWDGAIPDGTRWQNTSGLGVGQPSEHWVEDVVAQRIKCTSTTAAPSVQATRSIAEHSGVRF